MGNGFLIAKYEISYARPRHRSADRSLWINRGEETEPLNTSQPPADEMPDAPGEKRSGTIQSVSIAARFLKTLANAEGELALGEVARRTGTGGSTAPPLSVLHA